MWRTESVSATGPIVLGMGVEIRSEWDESFFDVWRGEEASAYWVCFWTRDDVESSAKHDPQRLLGATSVVDVLEWIANTKGDRRFELFVELGGGAPPEPSDEAAHRHLVRLAGDFRPAETTVTIELTSLS